MNLKRLLVGSFITNCYLLIFSDRVAVIDPGDNPEKIRKFCEGKPITDILLTHGHMDHFAALMDLREDNPRVYLHEEDVKYLNDDALRSPVIGGGNWRTDYHHTHLVAEGQTLTLGGEGEELSLQVLHTPGHTPGSVCYYDKKDGILFSGDTLFKESMGRTDFPLGNLEAMNKSLKKLSSLPPETKVYPGHGFGTTVGAEKWIGSDLY